MIRFPIHMCSFDRVLINQLHQPCLSACRTVVTIPLPNPYPVFISSRIPIVSQLCPTSLSLPVVLFLRCPPSPLSVPCRYLFVTERPLCPYALPHNHNLISVILSPFDDLAAPCEYVHFLPFWYDYISISVLSTFEMQNFDSMVFGSLNFHYESTNIQFI